MDKFAALKNIIRKQYVRYTDLEKMDENDTLLVNRIVIKNKLVNLCLNEDCYSDLYYKVADINRRIIQKDRKRRLTVFGIELSVKEIKEIFSREDLRSPTSLMLPRNNIKTNENITSI